MSVLDPDIGMDTEIFAQQRKGSLSGRLSEMSGYNGEPVNVDEAFDKVTEMPEKYFFFKIKNIFYNPKKIISSSCKNIFLIFKGKKYSSNLKIFLLKNLTCSPPGD